MRNTPKNFMIILALCLATALTGTSQETVPKPTEGWAVGLAPTYANQNGTSNLGLQAVATKALTPLWGWRCTASVNGLVPYSPANPPTPLEGGIGTPSERGRGFDRYATAMTGPVVNFSPLYAFLQVGAAFNPSTRHKIGPAASTGAGVAIDVGKHSRIFTEAAIDAVPTDGKWTSTFSAGIGYAVRL